MGNIKIRINQQIKLMILVSFVWDMQTTYTTDFLFPLFILIPLPIKSIDGFILSTFHHLRKVCRIISGILVNIITNN